jgi:hypothetical protein
MFLACALFPACAAPKVGPAHALSPKAGALLANAPASYAPEAGKIPSSPEQQRIRAAFENAVPPPARATLQHEPALDLVATTVAEMIAGEQQAPSHALVQWLFWRCGAASRYARIEALTAQGVDDLDLQSADLAGKIQASVYPEAYGLARVSHGSSGAQVLVIGRRPLQIDPLPKAYAPGAEVTLKVKPLDAFGELMLHADDGEGGVARERLTAAADGTFSITRKAPSKPGRYFIEVTGLDPRTLAAMPENPWRRSLFWVPIYVGVPEPTVPDDFMRAPSPNPADLTTWGTKIVEGYNEARVKQGKKPAATDGRLTALVQERSGLVSRAGREPPPEVVLADKLAASGYPPHDYDEFTGRLDSISDYLRLRLLEPAARQRLLSAEAPVVGVGLSARAPNAKGEFDFVVVEDVVDAVARLDPARDKPRVLAALDAFQTAEGRPAFKHDDDVAKAVQGFADEVCRGSKRGNQMKPLVDKARGIGEKFHQWATPVWRAGYDYPRWQETSLLAKSKEAPLTHVEVGLCQGDLPGKPGGSYVVVVPYGF